MKLLELHIDGFGKFHDRTISFKDGINIIYGKNEAGKSTLHTFIRGMLFGIERGRGRAAKNDTYSKFEPWENSGTYEGWLRLEKDGTIYRIERRFRKDNKSLKVINETRGREEEATPAFMNELLGGLNETTYNNTISIGQLKSATEDGMVSELRNYIANMNTTGNISLNISKASTFLRLQKRALEANLIPDASREYTALLAEIRNVEAEISTPEFENQLASYQNMRSQVKSIIDNTQSERTILEDKILDAKKILEEYQFTDQASVDAYSQKAEEYYNNYRDFDAKGKKKSRKVFSVFALLLAIACLAGAVYLRLTYPSDYITVVGGLGISALVFLLIQTMIRKGIKRDLAKAEENKNLLLEMFKKHLFRNKAGAYVKSSEDLGDEGSSEVTVSDEAMSAFIKRMAEFTSLCDMVRQSESASKKLMEDINSLREKQNNCSEMIEKQQRTQWELEKKLEHLNNCKMQVTNLKRVLTENDRIREEITAIELAQETLTELSSSIRDSFGLYLNKEASDLVGGITGGIYDSLSIDENLNVFLNTKRKLVPIEQVSSGTMDQVYLALRLAAAKLLQGDGEPFPLIFDDSFTQYDEERLRTALKWMAEAYGGQMLIFTCHKRESQILQAHEI
ncbi:MAG: AAA family ATPase, partial [Lachnospiraceae bacterium]|nr:AAA family ATPase [Lachnospiraceae bacterium]